MSPRTLRLVLFVSCAHALVHVFELSLPSVEQMIGADFHVGKDVTGQLGTVWRLPYGVGALFAGWLADRYGSKRLLSVYLFGCAATALVAWQANTLSALFMAMLAMGLFASIYHPAGLALIAHETTLENRGAALGWHGILGSIGIASAPFLASLAFASDWIDWRTYYLILTVPAIVLGVLTVAWLKEYHRAQPAVPPPEPNVAAEADLDNTGRLRNYFLLVTTGVLQGFIYAAFMHFLQRYLDEAHLTPEGLSPASYRNRLAALVLLCGVVGQAFAGRTARAGRLELYLSLVLFANAPFLLWMAFAQGKARLAATCLLAVVHFMNQPLYNSLIAQYVPRHRRSLSYGFNNMLTFGVGGLAPTYAGWTPQENWTLWTYGVLAGVALFAGTITLLLRRDAPVRAATAEA